MATETPNSQILPPDQVMQMSLTDPRVAKAYGNQFLTFSGPQDITLMLGVNGVATGLFTISYSVAKTLSENLRQAIEAYEKMTDTKVLDAAKLDAIVSGGKQ